jgi:hypothetical protein
VGGERRQEMDFKDFTMEFKNFAMEFKSFYSEIQDTQVDVLHQDV